MKAWYLIQSKPRQENSAIENLERQGYKTYLPLIAMRKRRQGRITKVIAPMFPRYLFIQLSDKTDDWRPIRSTIGVTNLVRFAQSPARVPDNLIATLKQREDSEGIQIIEKKKYKQGDKIQIAEGPFAGYQAIYQATTSRNRVMVLLSITEKHYKLQLREDQVELI